MLEKEIEKYLLQQVRRAGGECLKLNSQSANGIPDRMIMFSGAKMFFVELKKPGEDLRPLQKYWKKKLEGYGFTSLKIDSREDVDRLIREVKDNGIHTP